MKISKRDIKETQFVRNLIQQVDKIGLNEADDISDRILKNQPFIMSLLIGYKFDVETEQLNDIMKMLFVIYLFFETKTNIKKKKIDSVEFEKFQKKNIQFLKYFSEEQADKSQIEVNEQYLSNLRFKSLFTGILVMSNTQINLKKMDSELKGIIAMGMKTLIDCLESNLMDKKGKR